MSTSFNVVFHWAKTLKGWMFALPWKDWLKIIFKDCNLKQPFVLKPAYNISYNIHVQHIARQKDRNGKKKSYSVHFQQRSYCNYQNTAAPKYIPISNWSIRSCSFHKTATPGPTVFSQQNTDSDRLLKYNATTFC